MTLTKPVKKRRTSPPREHLCFSIYTAFHAFTAAYRILLEPLGLTYPQYLVMLVLWDRDNLRVSDIGDDLGLSTGTLTPLLRRLEQLGHIERTRSKSDERQVNVRLTACGHALELKAESMQKDLVCMTKLAPTDIRDLMDRILSLRTNLIASSDISRGK